MCRFYEKVYYDDLVENLSLEERIPESASIIIVVGFIVAATKVLKHFPAQKENLKFLAL